MNQIMRRNTENHNITCASYTSSEVIECQVRADRKHMAEPVWLFCHSNSTSDSVVHDWQVL